MGKRTKVLIGVAAAVVLLIVGAVTLLVSNLDEIVRKAVERVGTQLTGTEVTLQHAEISLRSSSGSLGGLDVANPPGFTMPEALTIANVRLDVDPSTLTTHEIVLHEVTFDGARLTFEQIGDANNLDTILRNIERADTGGASDEATSDLRVVIEHFRFTGGKVTVIDERLGEPVTLDIPEVALSDIGRVDNGETVSAAAAQILEPVMKQTVRAAGDYAEEQLKQRLEQELENRKNDALDRLKKRLEEN